MVTAANRRAVRLLRRQRQGRHAANLPRNRRGQTFVARLDIDHAIGHEPGLREGWGEQILPCDTPEHLTMQPRRDSRHKERRGRAVDRAMAAAGHLMQRAKCQSASLEDAGRSPGCRRAAPIAGGQPCPRGAGCTREAPRQRGLEWMCSWPWQRAWRIVCSIFVLIMRRESIGV